MSPPRILLSNDDGLTAAGLVAMRAALSRWAEVWVVAPDRERSAVSHSITLHRPLRIFAAGERCFAVDGSPTDCVYLGLHRLLPQRPDLVVGGINHGPNLGNDVLYSGTVAVAMEAALFGFPSFAISLAADGALSAELDFTAAAAVAEEIARAVLAQPPPCGTMLNVNVPAVPYDELRGIKLCRLGYTDWAENVAERHDPRGQPYYWIGGDRLGHDEIADSDNNAIAAGCVSVTPIHYDLTDHRSLGWARGLRVGQMRAAPDGLGNGPLDHPPHPRR